MGEFVSFTLFLGFMIAPIVQMSNIGSQLTEAMAGLDRTEELMNMTEEDDPEVRTVKLSIVAGNVIVDRLNSSASVPEMLIASTSTVLTPPFVIDADKVRDSNKRTVPKANSV